MRKRQDKLRIAWFSVLNCGQEPGASVAAYTSDCLLPWLRERFEIELYHNSFVRYRDYPTAHYLEAAAAHSRRPYDIFFYQLEDSPAANFVRIHLGLHPGVVLFHDLMLSNHGPEPILNSPWEETVAKYIDPAHPWPERGREFFREGPLGIREAAYAAAALFSNPVSHSDYRNSIRHRLVTERTSPPSYYLPLPAVAVERSQARRGGELRVGYCGTPRIEHRAHKLCSALAQLDRSWQLHWLLDAGEKEAAEALLEEFGLRGVVFREGRSPERWAAVVKDCDAAVHTIFSVFGQAAPYLHISMRAGVPAVVLHFASCEALPEDVVWKIEPGETEAAQMREVLRVLADDRASFAAERVRSFARENFDPRAIAAELAGVFEAHAAYLGQVQKRWQSLRDDARRALLDEARRLSGGEPAWSGMTAAVFQELGWI